MCIVIQLLYLGYKKGGLDKAVDLLMRMLDNGIVPDHITYFVILKMLPKCHELKYAMVILQAIFDNGCGTDRPVIDDLGNIEVTVESLLEEIARKDSNLAAVGLAVVTTVCVHKEICYGRVDEAEDTFAQMLESGIQPDEIAYIFMINAYARNGRINEANELVEEVVKHFVRPSSFTYTVLTSGFVKMGMMEKGCQYLDKMIEDGLSPNVGLYTSLIGHFLKKGNFKSSFTLFGLMGGKGD